MTDAEKTRQIEEVLVQASVDKICATELPFGPQGQRRIDVWTLEVAASKHFRATAYEIKVSRADFRRDSQVKQQWALDYSDRFFYVTPPSLISRDELPEWAGLIECEGKALKVIKRAPKREKCDPDWKFIVDLVRSEFLVRRDTSLLTTRIYQLESQHKRDGEALRMQKERRMGRQVRRFTSSHKVPCRPMRERAE